jgi:hypothetical protein
VTGRLTIGAGLVAAALAAAGGGDCKAVGTVRVIPDGEYLDYEFRGGGVESHGVPSRVE